MEQQRILGQLSYIEKELLAISSALFSVNTWIDRSTSRAGDYLSSADDKTSQLIEDIRELRKELQQEETNT